MSDGARGNESGRPVPVETWIDRTRRLGVVQFEHGYLALTPLGLGQLIEALEQLRADLEALPK